MQVPCLGDCACHACRRCHFMSFSFSVVALPQGTHTHARTCMYACKYIMREYCVCTALLSLRGLTDPKASCSGTNGCVYVLCRHLHVCILTVARSGLYVRVRIYHIYFDWNIRRVSDRQGKREYKPGSVKKRRRASGGK
jgi:hypothetical protein